MELRMQSGDVDILFYVVDLINCLKYIFLLFFEFKHDIIFILRKEEEKNVVIYTSISA